MDAIELFEVLKVIKTNDYKTIELVCNELDQQLYIKKTYTHYDRHLYEKLKKLNPIHTPKIEYIFENNNHLIVIEEYFNCPTLDTYIENNDLSNEQIQSIMIQLCDCLDILHKQNPPIIHRDIKPENIFYDGNNATLFDFDISRQYDETKNKDTMVLGSVGYAAPEQFGFFQSSSQSDIYSLGVLYNMMLTHQFPNVELAGGKEGKVIQKAISMDVHSRYISTLEMKDAILKRSWLLPGTDSNNMIIRSISIIGYGLVILMSCTLEIQGAHSLFEIWMNRLLACLMIMSTILFWANYQQIFYKLPGCQHTHILMRYGCRVLWYFVMLFILCMIFTFLL